MNKVAEDAEINKNEDVVVDEATQDETIDEEVVDTQDKTADDVNNEDEDTSDEDADDTGFKKRFTQFKGDTAEEYSKHLEDAYDNSTKEALKLKKQLDDLRAEKLSAIAKDTDLDSDEDKDSTPAPTPAESWAQEKMAEEMKKDYAEFVEAHPILEEDEEVFEKVDAEVKRYTKYIYSTEKRMPTIKESLQFAWKKLDIDDGDSGDKKVAEAVIDAGGEGTSNRGAKDRPKPRFSDKQIETARKVDPKLRDLSRADIEKVLAKYSN